MSQPSDATPGLAAQSDASGEEIAELYETWAASGDYDRDVEEWGYEAPERIADLATIAARPMRRGDMVTSIMNCLVQLLRSRLPGLDFQPKSELFGLLCCANPPLPRLSS